MDYKVPDPEGGARGGETLWSIIRDHTRQHLLYAIGLSAWVPRLHKLFQSWLLRESYLSTLWDLSGWCSRSKSDRAEAHYKQQW